MSMNVSLGECCRAFEESEDVRLINVSGENNDCQYNAVIEALARRGHDCGMSSGELRIAVHDILKSDFDESSGNSEYVEMFHRIVVIGDDDDYSTFREEYLQGVSGTEMGDMLTLQVIADLLVINIDVHVANSDNNRFSTVQIKCSGSFAEPASRVPRHQISLFLYEKHYRLIERRQSGSRGLAPSVVSY